MSILVTGGAGFIGSHTVLSLLNEQYDVVVIDNLCNSSPEAIKRVEKLAGRNLTFYHGDIRDSIFLEKIFNSNNIEAVIHCAALKSVGESNLLPLKYYSNNVAGALNLLQCMENNNVNKLIFSSSATVYGDTGKVPNSEADSIRRTTNPYGTSKYITEIVLEDIVSSSNSLSVISLRYFNPTGAHSSGLIGEDPNGIPSNLIPYVSKVAFGNLSRVNVFGCDYPTKDGTGIRDYIHVEDLALGHVKALDYIFSNDVKYEVFNLGTGQGYSVLDVIKTFEEVSGRVIPFEFKDRRKGDLAESWANPELAKEKLNWVAGKDLYSMLEDVWRWQLKNPNGYV